MGSRWSRRRSRSWLLAAGLSLAVVGCGGQVGDGFFDVPTDQAGGAGGDGNGGSDGNGGGDGFATEGPITIATDNQSFGYEIGRCEIIDGVVYAQARGGDRTGFVTIEATLPEWDREIAHSRRTGSIYAVIPRSTPGIGLELTASRGDAGTTWDWTVSGSQVEVTATLGDRTTATRDSGVETFTEYHDVTITMECSGTFGAGVPGEPMHEDFRLEEAPTDRVPGNVTVAMDGAAYEITYLTTCQFFGPEVSAEGISDEADVWFYSERAGVHLEVGIGDLRDEQGHEEWMLPPDSSDSDFRFEGTGTTRTWSGTVVSESGEEAEATITVECEEGDAFESAGTATITIDGVTYVLDDVVTCTIDGTSLEFFGREGVGDVAVVVTSGGRDLLVGDPTGQTVMNGVEFTIDGQQASWTGLLSGNRQATIAVDCGG
jgi:hypothetical protein